MISFFFFFFFLQWCPPVWSVSHHYSPLVSVHRHNLWSLQNIILTLDGCCCWISASWMQLQMIAIMNFSRLIDLLFCSIEYQKRVKNVWDDKCVVFWVEKPENIHFLTFSFFSFVFFSHKKLLNLIDYQKSWQLI